MKFVDLGEPTSFLDHVNLGCTQRECKPNEIITDEYRNCSKRDFLLEQLKNCEGGRNLAQKTVAWSYVMEGHAKKCVEKNCDLAKKKRQSNCTESQLLAWMIIGSNGKNLNQLENCQKYAHRLS